MNLKHSTIRAERGFTLVEAMIVVAVIGILAAIGYPSYLEHVARVRRAEARAVLLEASQYMKRHYAVNDRFDQDLSGNTTVLPAHLAQAPKESAAAYRIEPAAGMLARSSFVLEARPVREDKCGTLQINDRDQRAISGAAPQVTLEECWR